MPFSRLVVIAGVVALMTGCVSVKPQSDAEYKQSLADAEKTLAQKDADQAVAQFEEIAQRNPSKGEPWSYIAKIRFDQQKYGQAIVAADETLSRDPDDFVAKTVRAVGGLRVAMQSLADVRADALLAGNARPDAVALAEAMRETLGQDVLFPEGRRPPPRPRQPRKVDPAPAVKPAAGLPAAGATVPGAPAAGAPAAGAPAASPAASPGASPTASPSSQQPASPPAQQPNRAPNPFGDLLTK
ncbi:tetratricopeptide repeat protein [Achromobacter animicus]|uniref:tetratricopeptide repeat protein n=2 Tax=Achromobacter animicus TaxID=1389935 RepID=UPI0028B03810|nr:tetratricopeptide repeat protein [Achromobacter animicus]